MGAPGHPKMKKTTALRRNTEMYEKYVVYYVLSTKSTPKTIAFSVGWSQNQGCATHGPKRQKVSIPMASNATPGQPRCPNRHHKDSPREAKTGPKIDFMYLPCNTSIPEAILKVRWRDTKLRSGGDALRRILVRISAECSCHNTPSGRPLFS